MAQRARALAVAAVLAGTAGLWACDAVFGIRGGVGASADATTGTDTADGGGPNAPSGTADDGGGAAPTEAAGHHDLTDARFWELFDVPAKVHPKARGFEGAVFDGRYVYFVPSTDGTSPAGIVTRFETGGAFTDLARWKTFDLKTVSSSAAGFVGGVFDGRYVYFVPYDGGSGPQALVVRFDTQAPFDAKTSYETYDVRLVDNNAVGFHGAAFDGRWLYLVPFRNPAASSGVIARYDTQKPFATATSWDAYNLSEMGVSGKARGFAGAAFDGRYVYLAPFDNTVAPPPDTLARFDTTKDASVAVESAWTFTSLEAVSPRAVAFRGAAWDGRAVYYPPSSLAPDGGLFVRYEASSPFGDGGAFTLFDPRRLDGGAADGFTGAVFDGRFLYFPPDDATVRGRVTRYDSSRAFDDPASWSTFDVTSLSSGARRFSGGAFDGRYVYFAPKDGIAARFDARTPAALPVFDGGARIGSFW